ncbi:MAG TPA: hypothetical protein VIT22_14150 [Pseudoxanthomonas sp.]
MEYSHPILIKGRYHVVALTPEEEFDPGEITGYAVLNSSGARLRHELTLEDARAWMEKLVGEENLQHTDPPKRTGPARIRR